MKIWIGPLMVLLVSAITTHFLILFAAPRIIMDRAMQKMAARGVPLDKFVLAPRVTPQTQTVVRPSPDLAYSICRYDFGRTTGLLKVVMASYPGYSSLSFFDARTDNFLTLRGNSKPRSVLLAGPESREDTLPKSPTDKGLVLIRRLAPDQTAYDQVVRIAEEDICQPERG